MLTFAIDKGIISVNPVDKFKELAEPQTVLVAMLLQEDRRVQLVMDEDQLAGIYCGFLGETGLRKEEGLRVKWAHLNHQQRLLTVDASKNFKIRHVPLSDYALELLGQVTRVVRSPFVFTRLETLAVMKEPRVYPERARKKAKLE
jgi:integrase